MSASVQFDEGSNRRKSWADKVEEEEKSRVKPTIWDSFDISKISNAGFKLEYVPSTKQGEDSIIAIELDNFASKIEYWKSAGGLLCARSPPSICCN